MSRRRSADLAPLPGPPPSEPPEIIVLVSEAERAGLPRAPLVELITAKPPADQGTGPAPTESEDR